MMLKVLIKLIQWIQLSKDTYCVLISINMITCKSKSGCLVRFFAIGPK